MTEPKKQTCVIIINYNHSQLTLDAIASLGHTADIVVIDNSTDNDARLELTAGAQSSHFKILPNTDNIGYAKGVNLGLHYAIEHNYRFMFILNPDTLCSETLIPSLEDVCDNNPKINVLSPLILTPSGRILFAGTTLNMYFGRAEHRYYGKSPKEAGLKELFTSPTLTGSAIFVRREAVEIAGFMPEEYFLYYEDADWTLRMQRMKFKLYVDPSITMIHDASTSGTAGRIQQYYMYRNRIYFVKKYGNFAQRHFIWVGGVLDAIYTIKPYNPYRTKLFIVALKGVADAARNKTGRGH